MLEFSHDPPLESTRIAIRLLRTPAKGKLQLLITSADLIGCFTHFFSGRSMPCTGQGCEACAAGSSGRWHGYVAAIEQSSNEQIIFEVTAAAAEALANYRAKHGTLRGCDCIAARVAPRPNARVRLHMRPLDLSARDLPQPINLPAALCHIWGLPINECRIGSDSTIAPTLQHQGTRLPADRGNGSHLHLAETDGEPAA